MKPRVLIASEYNAGDRAHFALAYEFCRIVEECDDAVLVAPGLDNYLTRYFGRIMPEDMHNVQRDFNRLINGVRKRIGLRNTPTIAPVALTENYDFFFFVVWCPENLVELSRIPNWRSRCKVAVAYIFEAWSRNLEKDSRHLRLLDQFDHVFLLHSTSVPHLVRYTETPGYFLPTAVDCLIATPYPDPPERVIDVYSIGNRSTAIHRQLIAAATRQSLFYVYDSLSSGDSRVKNWHEHRLLLANMIKRSRYFMSFNPASLDTAKALKAAGEQVLPARLFEGAAGGAVMLGSAPQSPEFRECFDWPDALLEIPLEDGNIAGLIEELDAQPQRLERIRRTNAAQCLLRHDWVHRWEHILAIAGMEPLPQLHERKCLLGEIAGTIMPDPLPANTSALPARDAAE